MIFLLWPLEMYALIPIKLSLQVVELFPDLIQAILDQNESPLNFQYACSKLISIHYSILQNKLGLSIIYSYY